MFVLVALRRRAGCPLIGSVARDEAALLIAAVKLACWRAHSTLFVWMGRETPRKFCLCAGETSALYLYGTNMKLCEGSVGGLGQPS